MAAINPPSGFWKGLAINEANQVRVNLYLHFQDETITGRYELPGHRGREHEGSVTGTYGDVDLDLTSTVDGLRFQGRALSGVKGKWMIYGAIRFAGDDRLTSLTVFFTPQELEVFQGAWNSDDFQTAGSTSESK